MPERLVLATANAGKVAELRALVAEWGGVVVLSLADVGPVPLPEETGATYVENATLKARTVATATGIAALADDSGLEVAGLGWGPGVRSSRFAPTDPTRVATLLDALRGVSGAGRRARYRAAVALAWPDGRLAVTEGSCEGRIAERAEGQAGFGYDPVFVSDELGRSLGVASAAEKARVSHRARAVRALGRQLAVAPPVRAC